MKRCKIDLKAPAYRSCYRCGSKNRRAVVDNSHTNMCDFPLCLGCIKDEIKFATKWLHSRRKALRKLTAK